MPVLGLFGFFNKHEKEDLIKSIQKRKKNLLKEVKHLFDEEKKMKSYVALENHLLKSAQHLDPKEKAAIDKILAENRTEEEIIDYLARLEKQIISLLESGDIESIRTRLRKYVHTMDQLTRRIENLELSKKSQLKRIKREEEIAIEKAKSISSAKAQQEIQDKIKALEMMKKSVHVQKLENKVARKQFYKSVAKVGTNTNKLIKELLKVTIVATKITGNVGKIGLTTTKIGVMTIDKLARQLEKALK